MESHQRESVVITGPGWDELPSEMCLIEAQQQGVVFVQDYLELGILETDSHLGLGFELVVDIEFLNLCLYLVEVLEVAEDLLCADLHHPQVLLEEHWVDLYDHLLDFDLEVSPLDLANTGHHLQRGNLHTLADVRLLGCELEVYVVGLLDDLSGDALHRSLSCEEVAA